MKWTPGIRCLVRIRLWVERTQATQFQGAYTQDTQSQVVPADELCNTLQMFLHVAISQIMSIRHFYYGVIYYNYQNPSVFSF